jgi:hypothetical protein
MYQEKITFQEALLLEKENKIIIYNPNTVESVYSNVEEWKNNWNTLRKKYRRIDVNKLSNFANFEYLIEHKFMKDETSNEVCWVYMYGQGVEGRMRLEEANSKGKYVYILTNIAYPGICKIGKAVTPSKRVKQINGAGTVSEWVLRYALPVSDDYKVEDLVHQELSYLRMSSHQGSNREFFEIKVEEAIKCIEILGKDFITAKPIYY